MDKKFDQSMIKKILLMGLVLALLILAPHLISGYYLSLLALIGIFTIIASGLNVLTGMTGLVSLGHAGLFAIGAYFSALAAVDYGIPYWFSVPIGIIMAVIVGGLLALATLRVTGIYLAMVTIAFGMIIRDILLQWTWFSKGPWGITKIPPPSMGPIVFSPSQKYYLIVAITILTLIAIRNLRESRWGRALIAIRESPIAASSTGVNAYHIQTLAFAISAGLAGFGGAIYAHQESVISPDLFTFDASLLFLIIVKIGRAHV
jgi:branched-chain amino acid transport system permease protein